MIEQAVGSLVEVGFPPREALESILIVGHVVRGSALEHQAEAARSTATETDAALAIRLRNADDLPNLIAAARTGTAPDPDSTFSYGLALIVTGLCARHSELTGTPSARA